MSARFRQTWDARPDAAAIGYSAHLHSDSSNYLLYSVSKTSRAPSDGREATLALLRSGSEVLKVYEAIIELPEIEDEFRRED